MSELSDMIDKVDDIVNITDNTMRYPCSQEDMMRLLLEVAKEVDRQGRILDNVDANTVKKYVKR